MKCGGTDEFGEDRQEDGDGAGVGGDLREDGRDEAEHEDEEGAGHAGEAAQHVADDGRQPRHLRTTTPTSRPQRATTTTDVSRQRSSLKCLQQQSTRRNYDVYRIV